MDRACAPSGCAVHARGRKKKAELEEEDVEVSCTMTVHLQRFIPRKPHGEFGGWLPFE